MGSSLFDNKFRGEAVSICNFFVHGIAFFYVLHNLRKWVQEG